MPPIQEIIKQLREAEGKATKGEWFYDGIGYLFSGTPNNAQMVADDGNGEETRMRGVGANLPLKDNASLIVLMRNNLIPLLDYVETLQKALKTTERVLNDILVNNKPMPKNSNCCQADYQVAHGEEGTSHYQCQKCFQACDPVSNNMEKKNEWLETIVEKMIV